MKRDGLHKPGEKRHAGLEDGKILMLGIQSLGSLNLSLEVTLLVCGLSVAFMIRFLIALLADAAKQRRGYAVHFVPDRSPAHRIVCEDAKENASLQSCIPAEVIRFHIGSLSRR
jgi:hypothetical protein